MHISIRSFCVQRFLCTPYKWKEKHCYFICLLQFPLFPVIAILSLRSSLGNMLFTFQAATTSFYIPRSSGRSPHLVCSGEEADNHHRNISYNLTNKRRNPNRFTLHFLMQNKKTYYLHKVYGF